MFAHLNLLILLIPLRFGFALLWLCFQRFVLWMVICFSRVNREWRFYQDPNHIKQTPIIALSHLASFCLRIGFGAN